MVGRRARKRQPQRHVHRSSERRHLDRRHADVVIRRQHGIELSAHRPHEHGIRRKRPRRTEQGGGGPEHPLLLVAEQSVLAGMRIHRAHRDPRRRDAPPLPQGPRGRAAGPHHPVRREQRGHIAERYVSGDQHHAELLRRQHHRDVHVPGEVRQPLGVPGVRKARQVERMLVRRRGDDGVDFPLERQLHRRLDRVPGQPAGANGACPILGTLAASQAPGADGHPPVGGHRRNLVFRAHHGNLCVQRLGQGARRDLGADPTRIPERDRQTGTRAPPPARCGCRRRWPCGGDPGTGGWRAADRAVPGSCPSRRRI